MSTQNEMNNVLIKNVTFFWVHLDKAVSPFGTDVYDVQVRVPKARQAELEPFGSIKVTKDKEGKETGEVHIVLKKKAFKADGEPAMKPKCVNMSKQDINPATVGNGSTGNVIVTQRPFEVKNDKGKVTKKGVQNILYGIQVKELVEYKPTSSAMSMFEGEEATDEEGMF